MQGKTIEKTKTNRGNVLLYEYGKAYAVEDTAGKVYCFPIEGGLKAACDKYKELVAAAGETTDDV